MLKGIWHPYFGCIQTEDEAQEAPWVFKKRGPAEGEIYFPCCMLVQETVWDCSLERCAGLIQVIPSLEQRQHIAFSVLIGKVHKIGISILLRKSTADLASQTWLLKGQNIRLTNRYLDLA